jgi:hypothetical protein
MFSRIYVGLGEIVADEQKWQAGVSGGCVAQTIAEIEGCWMASFAVTEKGVGGEMKVFLAERKDINLELSNKVIEERAALSRL